MHDDRPQRDSTAESDFSQQVRAQATRKIRAQRAGNSGVWFGLGMSGLIGWSVTVPTVVGALLGVWIDRTHPGAHSWTLALLVAGLVIGCANAWHWVSQQDQTMHDDSENNDE
jgi:ATP synthase protein I